MSTTTATRRRAPVQRRLQPHALPDQLTGQVAETLVDEQPTE